MKVKSFKKVLAVSLFSAVASVGVSQSVMAGEATVDTALKAPVAQAQVDTSKGVKKAPYKNDNYTWMWE